jgi:hypothetical protein
MIESVLGIWLPEEWRMKSPPKYTDSKWFIIVIVNMSRLEEDEAWV